MTCPWLQEWSEYFEVVVRPAMMSSLEVEVEQFGWEEIVDDLVRWLVEQMLQKPSSKEKSKSS